MGDETNPRLRTILVRRDGTALVPINALVSRGLRDAVELACKTPGGDAGTSLEIFPGCIHAATAEGN